MPTMLSKYETSSTPAVKVGVLTPLFLPKKKPPPVYMAAVKLSTASVL
jgi:hypothetical protein